MAASSFSRFFKDTPIAFPLVALFHLFWTGRAIWDYRGEPFPSRIWMQVAWLLAYTVCWMGAAGLRRWGAHAYIVLTLVNLLLRYVLKDPGDLSALTDALFPIDVLCCFLLLLSYKRLR